mgnify:FL=1
MKANDYQNKIDEMNAQVMGNIVALLKKHNVTKLDFNTILDECKTTKKCGMFSEGDRLREMIDEHLIQVSIGDNCFVDCNIVSIVYREKNIMSEGFYITYKQINGGDIKTVYGFDLYTTVQILGLLEEFFDEFNYNKTFETIHFKNQYQVVKYVNGEKSLSFNHYKEKSDAVKEMLKLVASYASDHITHIEVDKDRVRLQTQDNVISYQVEEV